MKLNINIFGFLVILFIIAFTLKIYFESENIDEKSYIPLIASLISSYIIAFYIPWFKKKQ